MGVSKFLYAMIILAFAGIYFISQGAEKQRDATLQQWESIGMDELAKHGNAQNCWLLIHGKVYDVTQYIAVHPGRMSITQGCGKDATSLFEERPMGSQTPHSEAARMRLDDYYIGDMDA